MRRLCPWLLALAGCAHAPVESAAPGWKFLNASQRTEEIQFRTDQRLRRATVTEVGARGPDLDLKRAQGKLQGTSYVDRPVELELKGNEMVGRVAGDSFDLTLTPDGSETRATGLVAGLPSTFWLSPGRIRGSIGQCSFDLVWGAASYSGARTCGPQSDVVTLLLPPALASWSDPEVASLLAIFAQR
jgi:hypothetical protein